MAPAWRKKILRHAKAGVDYALFQDRYASVAESGGSKRRD
jgi:hypothetical protein